MQWCNAGSTSTRYGVDRELHVPFRQTLCSCTVVALLASSLAVVASAAEAAVAAEEASVLAAHAQAAADERAAELRVAQESMRTMRGEVNEQWVRSASSCSSHPTQ